jgi:hypothetical protein
VADPVQRDRQATPQAPWPPDEGHQFEHTAWRVQRSKHAQAARRRAVAEVHAYQALEQWKAFALRIAQRLEAGLEQVSHSQFGAEHAADLLCSKYFGTPRERAANPLARAV